MVMTNKRTVQALPGSARMYLISCLRQWDDLFPIEQEGFKEFFKKAKRLSEEEIAGVFKGVKRRGRRPIFETIKIAFDDFIYEDERIEDKTVLIVLGQGSEYAQGLGYTTHANIRRLWNDLIPKGSLLKRVDLDGDTNWLLKLLIGRDEVTAREKGLSHPTLFEYYRKTGKVKKPIYSAMALYLSDEDPEVSFSARGNYGRRFRPTVIRASDYEESIGKLYQEFVEARRAGKSIQEIRRERLRLTPKDLGIDEKLKDRRLAALVTGLIVEEMEIDRAGNSLVHALALRSMRRIRPSLLLVRFGAEKIEDVERAPWSTLSECDRCTYSLWQEAEQNIQYGDYVTFAIFVEGSNAVLFIGRGVKQGVTVEEERTIQDVAATVAALVGADAEYIQGEPIKEILTRGREQNR